MVLLCVFKLIKSHHEVWLCEDPPELLGLHVLWVTGDGFQYLVSKMKKILLILYTLTNICVA